LTRASEVRGAGKALAGFSPAMAEQERTLKRFMYEKLYYHPEQLTTASRAYEVLAKLFAAYSEDESTIAEEWRAKLPREEPQRSRHIADFIAGMTDRFAIAQYRAIYGHVPEGLSNV
jgi:dGTPase